MSSDGELTKMGAPLRLYAQTPSPSRLRVSPAGEEKKEQLIRIYKRINEEIMITNQKNASFARTLKKQKRESR